MILSISLLLSYDKLLTNKVLLLPILLIFPIWSKFISLIEFYNFPIGIEVFLFVSFNEWLFCESSKRPDKMPRESLMESLSWELRLLDIWSLISLALSFILTILSSQSSGIWMIDSSPFFFCSEPYIKKEIKIDQISNQII